LCIYKNNLIHSLKLFAGMAYLSKQKIVHRDLAARNCMLDSYLCVKIADFGLSRDIYVEGLYRPDLNVNRFLPVKWMAPECFHTINPIFNTKTDVWSYGVLVWEIMTYGETPYGQKNIIIVIEELKNGYRLPQPVNCPEDVYNLMLRCWNINPSLRLSFNEIVYHIQRIIEYLEELKKQNLAVHQRFNHLYVKPLMNLRF